MPARSAGVLLHRGAGAGLEVLLVHPGGPFWARKDDGAWSIPKGEYDPDADVWAAASREFAEELGRPVPDGPVTPLTPVRQSGGKWVTAFAVAGDLDATAITSNTFELEWPPRSGRRTAFPEVDRAEWFDLATAQRKLVAGQRPLIDELRALLGGG